MNENNTKMESIDEKKRASLERKEKIDSFFRKGKEKINNIKENISDKKEEHDTKKRIKEQEKTKYINNETTITNETITNKNEKKELSEQEKRKIKQKRKKLIRNIMTIPEIIVIILLVLFIRDKYIAHSNNVHQTLIYKAESNIYEIKRDNDDINVVKKHEVQCITDPCEAIEVDKYKVKFSKTQMITIRTYFDTIFKFKSTTKEITPEDLNTDIGQRSIRSIIHKDSKFLDTKRFEDYKIYDHEQKSDYNEKGYTLKEMNDKFYLYIAIGTKNNSGYSIVINEAHKSGNNITFYIKEQKPDDDVEAMQVITNPVITLELTKRPGKIKVYNIDTGDEYPKIKENA